MTAFVLIHGAFHGGWCFDPVAERLRASGHSVFAPDLPGMGGSEAELARQSLSAWGGFTLEQCRAAREARSGPVVLLGHSRGGMVISEAAEQDPQAMDHLVYLTALMVPADGDLHQEMAASSCFAEMQAGSYAVENGAGMMMKREAAHHHFAQNCSATDAHAALDRLVAEPTAVFATPVTVTRERWGSVPRTFIECTDDNALEISFQRAMIARSPGTEVVTLDADHSPFYSATDALVETLLQCGAQG